MIYPPEVKEYILTHYKGTGHQAMADQLLEKFNFKVSKGTIKSFYGNNHLNSGLTGRFEQGHAPSNKGKKLEEIVKDPEKRAHCMATMYKTGHSPWNTDPVGTEKMKSDGFLWTKIAEPNVWRQSHILLFERETATKVPPGKKVIFLDGNRKNITIENLALVTCAEECVMNKKRLRTGDKDATKLGLAIAQLCIATSRREKSND